MHTERNSKRQPNGGTLQIKHFRIHVHETHSTCLIMQFNLTCTAYNVFG